MRATFAPGASSVKERGDWVRWHWSPDWVDVKDDVRAWPGSCSAGGSRFSRSPRYVALAQVITS